MRVAVVGGGPAGLAFAVLARLTGLTNDVTVWERNRTEDTYGFGVVLPPRALEAFGVADPDLAGELSRQLVRWDRVTLHRYGRSADMKAPGLGAMDRRTLLRVLRRRCAELGVPVVERAAAARVAHDHDLVVAADGVRSSLRTARATEFGTTTREISPNYIWLGVDRAFDGLTFLVAEGEAGAAVAHAYPYRPDRSTFLVEAPDRVGTGELARRFADGLRGGRLLSNRSRWSRFTEIHNSTWSVGNVVLIGDAAHTSHYSIGSGTRLALDDAYALVESLRLEPTMPAALAAYEAARRPVVEHTQRVGRLSAEWFDALPDGPVEQLLADLVTRGGRISWGDLAAEGRATVGSDR